MRRITVILILGLGEIFQLLPGQSSPEFSDYFPESIPRFHNWEMTAFVPKSDSAHQQIFVREDSCYDLWSYNANPNPDNPAINLLFTPKCDSFPLENGEVFYSQPPPELNCRFSIGKTEQPGWFKKRSKLIISTSSLREFKQEYYPDTARISLNLRTIESCLLGAPRVLEQTPMVWDKKKKAWIAEIKVNRKEFVPRRTYYFWLMISVQWNENGRYYFHAPEYKEQAKFFIKAKYCPRLKSRKRMEKKYREDRNFK